MPDMPELAPVVRAMSCGCALMSFAIDVRMRLGTSKNAVSGMRCGNFFHSSEACTARNETFGIGLWPARLR